MVAVKLRILGNSIRLRLARNEVERVAGLGAVEDSVRFGPGEMLRYRLEAGDAPAARFTGDSLVVRLPQAEIAGWAGSEEAVSLRAEQPIGAGETLSLLVEKDFECLVPREDGDAGDLYTNPNRAGPKTKA